jgi:excisionase family DNA binding protein
MSTSLDELLTGEEIAEHYKVSTESVRRWARRGKLPVAAVTPGGSRRYRRGDVEECMRPKVPAR